MKVMFDANIALDILQQRAPHQQHSAMASLLHEMNRSGVKYGLVTMGMGGAGIFDLCE